jgi:hypothetical protein
MTSDRLLPFQRLLLDPDIDHERAAGNPLAIAAMAGVNYQWALGQFVSDRFACAST